MILQRMARQLRDRDWGALLAELFVVVVGIFLGLQVDAWNETWRRSRRRSARPA